MTEPRDSSIKKTHIPLILLLPASEATYGPMHLTHSPLKQYIDRSNLFQVAFHLLSYTLLRTKTKLKSRIYHITGTDSIRQMRLFFSIVEPTSF